MNKEIKLILESLEKSVIKEDNIDFQPNEDDYSYIKESFYKAGMRGKVFVTENHGMYKATYESNIQYNSLAEFSSLNSLLRNRFKSVVFKNESLNVFEFYIK